MHAILTHILEHKVTQFSKQIFNCDLSLNNMDFLNLLNYQFELNTVSLQMKIYIRMTTLFASHTGISVFFSFFSYQDFCTLFCNNLKRRDPLDITVQPYFSQKYLIRSFEGRIVLKTHGVDTLHNTKDFLENKD